MKTLSHVISPLLIVGLCTGCCFIGGQYRLIEGDIDPQAKVATLPVQEINTHGVFNIHRFECGQVPDPERPSRIVGSVEVPLDFCQSTTTQSWTWIETTFLFEVAGKKEQYSGFCMAFKKLGEVEPRFSVSLKTSR